MQIGGRRAPAHAASRPADRRALAAAVLLPRLVAIWPERPRGAGGQPVVPFPHHHRRRGRANAVAGAGAADRDRRPAVARIVQRPQRPAAHLDGHLSARRSRGGRDRAVSVRLPRAVGRCRRAARGGGGEPAHAAGRVQRGRDAGRSAVRGAARRRSGAAAGRSLFRRRARARRRPARTARGRLRSAVAARADSLHRLHRHRRARETRPTRSSRGRRS